MSEYLYGVQDGKPISIADIPVEMKGLKCGCICPECGRAFEACSLQGKVNRYFRHYSDKHTESEGAGGGAGPGCDVDWANESGLHKMAKHIIQQERKVAVPAVEVSLEKLKLGLPDHILKKLPPVFEYKKATVLNCTEVELERFISDFKPDAIAKTPDEYLIEVFARHKVPPEKVKKAAAYGAPMLEIDLSRYMEEPISYEDLRTLIVECFESREWKYHPDFEKAVECARNYFMGLPVVQEYLKKRSEREKEEQRKREEEERKARVEAIKREQRVNKLALLLQPDNYAKELARLRNDNAFMQRAAHGTPNDFLFYKQHHQIPFYIDIPITGEMVFQCDRRIWQGTIFNRYVYKRNPDKNGIKIDEVFNALTRDHHIPVDWDLTYKISLPNDGPFSDEYFLRRDVVRTYLGYLEYLGFITIGGYRKEWATVHAMRTITPPDQEAVKRLQAALQKVDTTSPFVDKLICAELQEHLCEKAEARELEVAKAKEARRKQRIEELQKRQEERREKELAQITAACEKAEQEKKQAALRIEERHRIGREEVSSCDFTVKEILRDRFGLRWVQCTSCNNIFPDSEMSSYQYRQGTCCNCSRK